MKEKKLFGVQKEMMPSLAQEVGCYTVSDAKEMEKQREISREAMCQAIRSVSESPYALCEIVARENVIVSAASMHFGLMIQKDDYLFRAFYLVNQQGVQQQLLWISSQIETAKTSRDREAFQMWTKQKHLVSELQEHIEFGLEHVKSDILSAFSNEFTKCQSRFGLIVESQEKLLEMGRETIDSLGRIEVKVDRIDKGVDEIKDEIQGLKEQLGQVMSQFMNARQISRQTRLSDTLSIRTSSERESVKQFLKQLRDLKKRASLQEVMALQIDVSSLLGAAQETEDAESLLIEVQKCSNDQKEKGLAAYNRFINFTSAREFGRAFVAYREAIELDRAAYELFKTRKYRPEKILGAGGFGVVFLCEDEVYGKVVVKSLSRPEGEFDLDMLIKEARALAKTHSPYIIGLKEYEYMDWDRKERPYLVLDYFESEDMESHIEKQGAFGIERGIEIAQAIAQGMREAHDVDVIHRDLKPANILYRESKNGFELRIIDFGLAIRGDKLKDIAKSIKSSGNKSIMDESFGGTVQYAPPEQMGEEVEGKLWPVGRYSDVYAYGRTLKKIFFKTLKPSDRLKDSFANKEIRYLISDCEEEDPQKRPQDFDEVLQRLEEAKGGKVFLFPESSAVSLEEAWRKIDEKGRGSLEANDLFTVSEEHDEKIEEGKIAQIKKKGSVQKGKVIEKAVVVLSKGRKPVVMEFPGNLQDPYQELRKYLKKGKAEECWEIVDQEHHETIEENNIVRVMKKGRIVDGILQEKAQIVTSKGAKPKGRYQVSPEGIIHDSKTGLDWYVGPDKGTNWHKAKEFCDNLRIAGCKWRLPKVEELRGIYEQGKGSLNMDPVFQTTGWWVWADDEEEKNSASAPLFYFGNGGDARLGRDGSLNGRVFAVRV